MIFEKILKCNYNCLTKSDFLPFYWIIFVSFYRNIVCKSILCDVGLTVSFFWLNLLSLYTGSKRVYDRLVIGKYLETSSVQRWRKKLIFLNWFDSINNNSLHMLLSIKWYGKFIQKVLRIWSTNSQQCVVMNVNYWLYMWLGWIWQFKRINVNADWESLV